MVYFGSADGSVNLLYPFMGHVLIGATDIPVSDPDLAVCDEDERRYLAGVTREIFPTSQSAPRRSSLALAVFGPCRAATASIRVPSARDHEIAIDTMPDGTTRCCL